MSPQPVPSEPPVEVTPANVEQILAAHGHHGPDFGLVPKRGDFLEEFHSDKTAPGFNGATDFPFDEVCRHLDGEQELDHHAMNPNTNTAEVLRTLMEWIKSDSIIRKDQRVICYIGKRAIAAIWVINPSLFGNMSGHSVAESYGISHINFSRATSEFSRRFGFQNQFQVHDGKNPSQSKAPLNEN